LSSSVFIFIAMIFVFNLGLIAWAITDLMHREKVKYLPKFGWVIIIAFIIFGSIVYLLAGRGSNSREVLGGD